jgi:hypothetical protein
VTLVRTDVSEERVAFKLADSCHPDDGGDTFFESSVLTRAARLHIPEDGILHNHRRENFKYYIALTGWTL